MRKSCSYDKPGILTLADNKPVVYRIQDRSGKDNFVGAAKRGRLDKIAEHLGCVPGSVVKIWQHDSLADAVASAQRIINRCQPKYNRREAGSRVQRTVSKVQEKIDSGEFVPHRPASPSAYQRKLGEGIRTIVKEHGSGEVLEVDADGDIIDPMLDAILAVLASEGVRPPEGYCDE